MDEEVGLLVGLEAAEHFTNGFHRFAKIAVSTHEVQLGLEAALDRFAKAVDHLDVIVGELSVGLGRTASGVER